MINDFWTLLIVIVNVGFFLLGFFVLPYRKLPEEKGKNLLHVERCFARWTALWGGVGTGGILPARISFYDDFFVVSRITLAKFQYSEIQSVSFKHGWLLNSVVLNFGKGRSLFFRPKNLEKVQSLIDAESKSALVKAR